MSITDKSAEADFFCGKSRKKCIFLAFFYHFGLVVSFSRSTFAADFKIRTIMLTYQLLKIAPDGGQFATTTIGMLLSLMEFGLALWIIIATIISC